METTNMDSLEGLAQLVLEAFTNKNWALLAVAGIMLLVFVARKYGSAKWPWLATPKAAIYMAFILSVGGAIATSLVAGQAITLALVVKAVLAGLGAMGLWSGTKTMAEAAGKQAMLKITNDKTAVDALGK